MKRSDGLPISFTRKRGAVAVFTLVMLVVLIGFASLTIDVGVMFNTRAELQNAADASALAGASSLDSGPSVVRARVKEIASQQRGLVNLDVRDEDILLGQWDASTGQFNLLTGPNEADANAVRVIARMTKQRGNPVQLYFAALMGHHTADVTASATASFGSVDPWNIVITQDVTKSFIEDVATAKVADQGLLDCIHTSAGGESQVGLVTFTGYGQVVSPLQPVQDNYSQVSSAISKITVCGTGIMPKCSGTNIGAGLDAAISILKDLDSDSKLPPAIVLVSDGKPEASIPGYTTADLEKWAVDSANTAASLGISIYTVFYSEGGVNQGEAFLAGLVRGEGKAYSTPEPDKIAEKLELVCKGGLRLMLVQ